MTEYFKKTGVPTTRNKKCLFQETEFFYSYYLQDYNLFIYFGGRSFFFFLSEYQSDHTQDAPQQRAPDAHLGCWGVLVSSVSWNEQWLSYTKQEKIQCLLFTFAKNAVATPLPSARVRVPGPWHSSSQTWCSAACSAQEVHLVPKAHSKIFVSFHLLSPWICK